MKVTEVRGKDDAELELDLRNLRKELFDMHFKSSSEQVANPARFGQIRRDVARILTVLGERRRSASKAGSAPQGDRPAPGRTET